jgi:class 3 adenylate cyclase
MDPSLLWGLHSQSRRLVAILPGQPATERLAAIFAIDVVGHRRLMEADEAGTLATLKARRKGCWSRSSPSIGGHIA